MPFLATSDSDATAARIAARKLAMSGAPRAAVYTAAAIRAAHLSEALRAYDHVIAARNVNATNK